MYLLNSFSSCSIYLLTLSLVVADNASISGHGAESELVNVSNVDGSRVIPEDETGKEEFSIIKHPSDHSIYAQRSLMFKTEVHRQDDLTSDDDYEALKTFDYAEKEWQLMFRSIDSTFNSLSSVFGKRMNQDENIFEEILSKLPHDCRRDIIHVMKSAKKHKLWALRMLDSIGKIPSGLSYGRFTSPGDHEECVDVSVNDQVYINPSEYEQYKFRGKYCLIDFRLPMPERPKDQLLSVHFSPLNLTGTDLIRDYPELAKYSGYSSVFYEIGYMHGFCLPSSCQIEDVTKSMTMALEGMHILVNSTVDCEVRHPEGSPWRKSQIIPLIFLIVLFLNAGCASIMYYIQKDEDNAPCSRKTEKNEKHEKANTIRSKLNKWAQKNTFYTHCFAVQTNFERLSKPDPRGLTTIHYTRILAMALTVVTHTAALGTLQAIIKPADASNSEQIFRDFLPQMLANAFSSIQIFFFMAGMMLVISTYPSIVREKGHMSFLEHAIKRAIRLMPGVGATICLNFLWPLVVDGPMVKYFERVIVEPCETNWWRTLLFISNFDHVEKICLRHSYFSASDYQLHIMAYPLIILLYKQPMLSLFIAGLFTLSGFAAQVMVILTKIVLPFIMVDSLDKEAFFNVVHYIHHPVWNHISAFFYGFIIGYLIVKRIRINMSPIAIKRTWITVVPLFFTSIFAPYFWNHYKRPMHKWQMILYVIFDRFILLSCCAWFAYGTMVLGKKPKKSKPTVEQKNGNKPVQSSENANQIPSVKVDCLSESADRFQVAKLSSTVPRQRSTPSFLTIQNIEKETPQVKPAASTINVNFTDKPKAQTQRPEPKKRISDVNTLCLILSRLTFQLYLANMVVLWVDVNHSKYIWYLSYYFIFTKAFAVYICSTLISVLFFVTLESPCLSIYIMWVKNRAEKRAKIQSKRASHDDVLNLPDLKVIPNKKPFANSSPNSHDGSFEGLSMRVGTPNPVKSTFNYVDLSESPDSDQTKM